MTPRDILKQYWGYDSFRPMQEDIINSILSGTDTLALLPTGGGKSICFQVPALLSDGLCLVISPLIALMKDQVLQLRQRNIEAAYLVSGMNRYEIELVLNNCIYGKTKLLYISPERLKSRLFLDHCRQMQLSLIAVDEAHCISQWGYDFRPSYLDIGILRNYHPHTPVMALTASATPEVVVDIQDKLCFRKGRVFRKSFFRDNLAYMVIPETDKQGRLLRIIRKVGGSGIVYVRNRRRTQEVTRFLQLNGLAAEAFHAGMTQKERDLKQSVWMQNPASIMVATNAFGMGIDKPDVRFVVHLDIPDSPEAYFQEAGRAGRDGNKAFAVLLFEPSDEDKLYEHFEQSFPSLSQIRNVYRALGNYYQIPVGSGANLQCDFDLDAICRTYDFAPVAFYSAARFLEKEGLIALPDRGEAESSLFIPISREDLYRFEVESRRFGDFMKVLLRMYGGLFTDFIPINESDIARICHMTKADVANMLLKLDENQIVSYKPMATRPQILFLASRIETDGLYISDANYKELKEAAMARLQRMLQYVKDRDICRSRFLSAYFGDQLERDCGMCDLCIQSKPAAVVESVPEIQTLLTEQPLTIKELALQLDTIEANLLSELVQKQIDLGNIAVDEDFRLHWQTS